MRVKYYVSIMEYLKKQFSFFIYVADLFLELKVKWPRYQKYEINQT